MQRCVFGDLRIDVDDELTVSFDARHRWQRMFFEALCIFDKGDRVFEIKFVTPAAVV